MNPSQIYLHLGLLVDPPSQYWLQEPPDFSAQRAKLAIWPWQVCPWLDQWISNHAYEMLDSTI